MLGGSGAFDCIEDSWMLVRRLPECAFQGSKERMSGQGSVNDIMDIGSVQCAREYPLLCDSQNQ